MHYLQFIQIIQSIKEPSLKSMEIHTLGDHIISDIEIESVHCMDVTPSKFPETLQCKAKGITHFIDISAVDVLTVRDLPLMRDSHVREVRK